MEGDRRNCVVEAVHEGGPGDSFLVALLSGQRLCDLSEMKAKKAWRLG